MAVFVSTSVALSAFFGTALLTTLPSNAMMGRSDAVQLKLFFNVVASQGFGFFTRDPQSEQTDAYQVLPDGSMHSLLITPQTRSSNLYGVSRRQRAQGPELAALDRQLTQGWRDCESRMRERCLTSTTPIDVPQVKNESPIPTICGDVIFTVEHITKWAYRDLISDRYAVFKFARANVQCNGT
ncbi:antimicrobial peptide system protein, SdpA family [Mycobacteroides abscessus subsp. abscessus]|uniref:SdpA family antimicrobial peptide system protein n=1 Tax=Mycobacteroides abscessus TaxID=36809 RepID=UPI0009285A27|nr:SdpA family antimicrobial peptide system protein [Mycobacteroides abscessus]SIE35677.1 antimicrobial peptide system protein, SdpA family [Mycobacteroides abscessus subsp. abscessus]SKV16469.1 antimicrobial peptide system protein, SdpA family [Mycobacteroides abscessus subsp. abscessus]